jgi:hypothetical protein
MRAAVVAITMALISGCTALRTPDATGRAPSPSLVGPSAATKLEPNCGTIDIGSSRYEIHFSPTTATPGDRVIVRGTTLRTEGGRFAPSSHAEVWWNTLVPQKVVADAEPIVDGSPVVRLATIANMDRCRLRTVFTIPYARPGRYQVRTFIFHKGGYGVSPPVYFTVH